MNIMVKNKIIIEEPTQDILRYCESNLKVDNPEYFKKQKMGRWTGNTPKEFVLFQRVGNDIVIPFGCLNDVWRLAKDAKYKICFNDLRKFDYKSTINLYDYQEQAVMEALKKKNGILVMPCGGGKTQTGLEIIARIGGRALWLTHTQDLLNQSKERAKSVFDCNSDYGTITSGKVNIGNGLTFATVQTMAKLNLKEYENAFDVVIVDECHKAVGGPTKVMQFYKVLSSLNARYKIGLTATPKRADGMEKSMFVLIGNVIHEVSKEEVKNTTCDVEVAFIETGYKPDYSAVLLGDGTLNYSALVQDMVDNERRFDKVRLYVMDLMPPFIVLANRVEYLSRLTEAYNYVGKGVCLSTLGQSKKAKAERKEVLRKLNNGEIDAVFATYQLAKEGLDVPNLKTVVFATPEKDETTVVQSVGRVGRKGKDKDKGYVVDFVDDFAMYRGWQQLRMRYYKKNDIKIEE